MAVGPLGSSPPISTPPEITGPALERTNAPRGTTPPQAPQALPPQSEGPEDLDEPGEFDMSSWGNVEQSFGALERSIGADMYSFMKLMHEVANQLRKTAREDRDASAENQMKAMEKGVAEMRAAAGWRLAAGIVSGALTIAAGAVTIAGGVYQAKVQADMSRAPKKLDTEFEMTDLKAPKPQEGGGASPLEISNRMGPIGSKFQGSAQIVDATGKVTAALLQHQGELDDVAKQDQDRKATLEDQRRQRAIDQQQTMQDLLRDLREKISAMQQSQNQTLSEIARV